MIDLSPDALVSVFYIIAFQKNKKILQKRFSIWNQIYFWGRSSKIEELDGS